MKKLNIRTFQRKITVKKVPLSSVFVNFQFISFLYEKNNSVQENVVLFA